MGLSTARRALVIDGNPWNRRQICDVLDEIGYEVSACDSLHEGRKFYRHHPIVVAGTSEVEGATELDDFLAFVREAAGESGGYLIRVAAGAEDPAQAGAVIEVEDSIALPLDRAALERKFRKADDWLKRQGNSAFESAGEVEIISSQPEDAAAQPSSTNVKDVPETEEEGGESRAVSAVMLTEGQTPPADDSGAAPAVSIRRGKAVRRDEKRKSGQAKEKSMPEKTTKYQYNLLIENAPLAMAMFDTEMRYLVANRRWRRHFDLEEAEVIDRSHFDIFSEVSDRWQMLCDRANHDGREVVGEEYVEWPDGGTDWVRWTMQPWVNKEGERGGLVVSCGVVTEEKAKRSEQQLDSGLADSLMNSGVTPVVILDFNGRVLRCNRIAKRWGDWGAASGDDRYFWDAFVPADNRQEVRDEFAGHAAAMLEGGEFKFPPVSIEPVRSEDGGDRRVAWTNTPRIGADGVVTGLVRVGVEIRDEDLPTVAVPPSEQVGEDAVAELQDEWMDSFPLMCWRTNSRGKIKFFNRQWLDFRGRNALEECDNGWMDGLHDEDYDSLIHAFDTAAKTGARVNHVARMLGGDGQYRWLRFVSARDFSDLEGASDGFIGYCEDLARIIRLESELSAAKSRYDELLEDSTSAFRAKRALDDEIKGLNEKLVSETARLGDEREAAVAGLTAELERVRGEGEQLLADKLREKDEEIEEVVAEKQAALAELEQRVARASEEQRVALAEIAEQKDAQMARALEDKEVALSKLLSEKQSALAQRESSISEELAATEAELERVRAESEARVAELEKERDAVEAKFAGGVEGLKTDLAALKASLETAQAEKAQLEATLEAEQVRQRSREAEVTKLRKDIDAAHKELSEAATGRDRFVTIPENAPFGMVLVDRDGSVLYANPATDEIAGVEFGRFEKVEDWLLAQGPDDDGPGQQKLLKVWREGIWRQDGTKVISMRTETGLRELELRSKLLPDGQLLLSMFDVTDSQRAEDALRASEVKFRSIFYDSGVGMALVDKTGNIFDANPAQEKLLGYTRAELRKMHIEDCLSLEEIARTQALAKQMAETRSRSGEMTIRLQPKDGRPAWAHMNVSLVRDPDGEVIFAAYFFPRHHQGARGDLERAEGDHRPRAHRGREAGDRRGEPRPDHRRRAGRRGGERRPAGELPAARRCLDGRSADRGGAASDRGRFRGARRGGDGNRWGRDERVQRRSGAGGTPLRVPHRAQRCREHGAGRPRCHAGETGRGGAAAPGAHLRQHP